MKQKEELETQIFELLRQLVTSARIEDKVAYRAARKELKRLKMENKKVQKILNYIFQGLPK